MMHTLLGIDVFDPAQFKVVERQTHRGFLDSAAAQMEMSGRGRADVLLKVIREDDAPVSVRELMDLTGWTKNHVQNSVHALLARGDIKRVSQYPDLVRFSPADGLVP